MMLNIHQNIHPNVLYARLAMVYGLRVFPCRAADDAFGRVKSPLTKKGFKDAVCDLKQLNEWAQQYPHAMYGLPCALNGLFTLDADRHGNGDGVSALCMLFKHHRFDWSSAPCVRTPNGGLHIYFQRPSDLSKTRGKVGTAIDTRDNGYVILPGSKLTNSSQYFLLNGDPQKFAEYAGKSWLAPMPAWLRIIVEEKSAIRASQTVSSMETQARQIEGILQKVRMSAQGERNNILHWAACRGAEAIARRAISFDHMEALLVEAGKRCGLNEDEARRTVCSGLRSMAGADDVR